jgi:hypothetical protein
MIMAVDSFGYHIEFCTWSKLWRPFISIHRRRAAQPVIDFARLLLPQAKSSFIIVTVYLGYWGYFSWLL